MSIEFYSGKPVFIKCPSDLWTFDSFLSMLDDSLGETHFVKRDPDLRRAWCDLLCAVETAVERFSICSGSCDVSDMITLALSDSLPEGWEFDE